MVTKNETFTEEDQKAFDALMAKKIKSDWKLREEVRKDSLSKLQGLADVFTLDNIHTLNEVVNQYLPVVHSVDTNIANLMTNVQQVLGYSGITVAAFLQQLATAEPDPTTMQAPSVDAPAE